MANLQDMHLIVVDGEENPTDTRPPASKEDRHFVAIDSRVWVHAASPLTFLAAWSTGPNRHPITLLDAARR